MSSNVLLDSILGYLNLSDGSPSAAFARGIDAFYRGVPADEPQPWDRLLSDLAARLGELKGQRAAFHDDAQAAAAIGIVRSTVLPAYRLHHRDLLSHLTDPELFQPFFLVRVFEAVLGLHGPWHDAEMAARRTLDQLNDFVGHRPLAMLEHDQSRQPYDHERVRPIPVYLKGVGTGYGPMEPLISSALATLASADPQILIEGSFDPDRLEELAVDPRAYDFGHPADQRPGYQFGEWDPQSIDHDGHFCRFVLRREILLALLDWMEANASDSDHRQRLCEASTVLAGTILLAAGISGASPSTHGSDETLGTLVQRMAACRDRFYADALDKAPTELADRLRAESRRYKQPMGAVRQFLNGYIARRKGEQFTSDRIAQLYARLGYEESSRSAAGTITTPPVRVRSQLECLLVAGARHCESGALSQAADCLDQFEENLTRGIACGAIVDPWNILAFQGQFPLFPAIENSVADPRVAELLGLIHRHFELYARVLRELAARGEERRLEAVTARLRQFADAWDRYASYEVAGVRRVYGREHADAATFVAQALVEWRAAGATAGDVAFWRRRAKRFESPQSVALVVEALLQNRDLVSSMALLMHWLSQADAIPLEGPNGRALSFYQMAMQWMAAAMQPSLGEPASMPSSELIGLLRRFFDHLEANAEDLMSMTLIDADTTASGQPQAPSPFAAAYDNMTFRDSAADGHDSDVLGQSADFGDDILAATSEQWKIRFRFQAMLARLWQAATTAKWPVPLPDDFHTLAKSWLELARSNRDRILHWMDVLQRVAIRKPVGTHESILEFERAGRIREELVQDAMQTAIEMSHAMYRLLEVDASLAIDGLADWELAFVQTRRALRSRRRPSIDERLRELTDQLGRQSVLYTPLEKGGEPHDVFRVRCLREALCRLLRRLPACGCIREAHRLLEAVADLEERQAFGQFQVSEFSTLFHVVYVAVVETIVDVVGRDERTRTNDEMVTGIVGAYVAQFARLWVRHTSTVRISQLERRTRKEEWDATMAFIQLYGATLFTQKFMALGNLRGILQSGVALFLDRWSQQREPNEENRLLDDLQSGLADRDEVIGHLEFILHAIVESYDVYLEYNASTSQSDYGENLFALLEMLRIKATYDRHRWSLEPAYAAHRILARRGRVRAARLLQQAIADETASTADDLLQQLNQLQERLGLRLVAIEDRLAGRFVRPLGVDRVLAQVEAVARLPEPDELSGVFRQFAHDLEQLAKSHSGSGADAPSWLQEVELEVARSRARSGAAALLEDIDPGTKLDLTLDDLEQGIKEW